MVCRQVYYQTKLCFSINAYCLVQSYHIELPKLSLIYKILVCSCELSYDFKLKHKLSYCTCTLNLFVNVHLSQECNFNNYMFCSCDNTNDVQQDKFRNKIAFLFQVALIATSSYNRMMQPNYEQQLYEWLWEMMLTLRLHPADLPMPVMQFTQQLPNEEELEGKCNLTN